MWRNFIIISLLLGLALNSYGSRPPAELHEGDLIFVSLKCFACQLIQKTTHSPFSHVAIVTKSESGAWHAVMAVPPAVIDVPLDFFYKNSLIPPQIMRMQNLGDQNLAAMAAKFSKYYIGVPYDPDYVFATSQFVRHFLIGGGENDFVLGPQKLYCSDLISSSFYNATGNTRMPFPLVKMDFGKYQNEWETVLGHPPPQGQWGISPGDIARSPELMIIN